MDLRVAKCLLVSKVLVADGFVTDHERVYLESFMTQQGLSPEERQRVIDLEGWDEAEAIVAGLSADEKQSVVDALLGAAAADGRLSPLEVTAVNAITRALGLP
jgi:uncharacterized tellurite resistance protein B-like protein